MMALAARFQPFWPWAALFASLAMLAVAHASERLGGLNPCALCLTQREVYWGAAAVALAGAIVIRIWPRVTLRRAVAVLLGLAFLSGALVAAYHVGVEQGWFIAQCDRADLSDIRVFDPNATFQAPNCDEVQWALFGVSMAGYNVLASLGLAAASFLVAFATPPAQEEN